MKKEKGKRKRKVKVKWGIVRKSRVSGAAFPVHLLDGAGSIMERCCFLLLLLLVLFGGVAAQHRMCYLILLH